MGIFGRGRKKDQAVDVATDTAPDIAPDRATDVGNAAADAGDISTDLDASPEGETPAPGDDIVDLGAQDAIDDDESFSRARGPFDVTEVTEVTDGPEGPERLDLGSIRLVPLDGMQLRLELDESQQTVLGAHALIEGSGVQLQAFAAPRTSGVWPDIRSEIAESIVAQGGTADVVRGPLGRELLTRMKQPGPDGRTVFAPVRFIGVDGPRWFLRAVLSGAAADDDTAAAPLIDLVRSVVVVRGDEAMPPREILPLRLPPNINPDGPAADGEASAGDEGAEVSESTAPLLDDLKPFERGPEITEAR